MTPTEESVSRAGTPPNVAEERDLWLQALETEEFAKLLLLDPERDGSAM